MMNAKSKGILIPLAFAAISSYIWSATGARTIDPLLFPKDADRKSMPGNSQMHDPGQQNLCKHCSLAMNHFSFFEN
jgi:hypothetical protein